MNFLEANKWIKKENDVRDTRDLLVLSSGFLEPLALFMRACSVQQHGIKLNIEFIPFNTLRQFIASYSIAGSECVFLLAPWDFCHELDWRTGIPPASKNLQELFEDSNEFFDLLQRFKDVPLFYLNAPTSPIFSNKNDNYKLKLFLENLVQDLNTETINEQFFSLGSYLSSGCCFSGENLGTLANTIVSKVLSSEHSPKKVLVTDLDNTLWNGVIAEDGLSTIRYDPEGAGFKHFIYQTYLKKIKAEGTLLAAVSRNDPKDALKPLKSGQMILKEEDFVAVIASYEAKSSQIVSLGKSLNLLLDSFVFVDDSPLEIEEVQTQLPEVKCYQFPKSDNDIPAIIHKISNEFTKTHISTEDKARTERYRSQLSTFQASTKKGSDISAYLQKLDMELLITDRTKNNRDRAEQLIQKTNQFNLNGIRFLSADIELLLKGGGTLYTGRLKDQTGDHGEILVCLLSPDNIIKSFVLSCRVFQRRIEYVFFSWLCRQKELQGMEFLITERNLPFQKFLEESEAVTKVENGLISLDNEKFIANINKSENLLRIHAT
jgi:FkbH-like protein